MSAQIAEALRGLYWTSMGEASRLHRIVHFPARSRELISTHRRRHRELDRKISDRSRRGLDWTNFFMADVQVGFSSFLAFSLAELNWTKQDVGFALTDLRRFRGSEAPKLLISLGPPPEGLHYTGTYGEVASAVIFGAG